MQQLLTIKEAASFLNVSEMSLRRWTNSGKLTCYRVGGKQERRFNKEDLINFLHTGTQKTTPLGIRNHQVKHSSHIAHFYRNLEESLDEGISYLHKGLSLGENVLIISPKTRLQKVLDGLEKSGVSVSTLLGNGTITTDTGRHTPNEQLQFMNRVIAPPNSAHGFRLLGDMTWAMKKNWSLADLTILEDYTNSTLAAPNKLFLCQYDLEQCSASVAMMALDSHRLTSYRGELQESPYFTGKA